MKWCSHRRKVVSVWTILPGNSVLPRRRTRRSIRSSTVYRALEEKGYNPINQIVGYILSEDPTYITNHNNARTLIRKIDRDELLQVLVRRYLGQ